MKKDSIEILTSLIVTKDKQIKAFERLLVKSKDDKQFCNIYENFIFIANAEMKLLAQALIIEKAI